MLDDATAEEFRRLHAKGATRERIEAAFGITPSTARKWARRLGIEFKGRQKVDAAALARMRSLFEQGFSTAEIATELDLGKSTVTKRLQDMGLKRSRSEAGRMGRARSPEGAAKVGGAVFGSVETAPPPTPREGLFQPVQVLGDGPLARRYREQLEEQLRCRKG